VYRRLADPAFRAQVNEVRADTVRRAADMFSAASLPAIKTLMTLHESATSESVRLGAARAIIELGCKLRENVELTARLAALETRLEMLLSGLNRPGDRADFSASPKGQTSDDQKSGATDGNLHQSSGCHSEQSNDPSTPAAPDGPGRD
jgi:hypothetical protein